MIRFILVFFVIADGRALSSRILHGECLIFSLKYHATDLLYFCEHKKTQRIIQTTKLFGNSSGKKHTQQNNIIFANKDTSRSNHLFSH